MKIDVSRQGARGAKEKKILAVFATLREILLGIGAGTPAVGQPHYRTHLFTPKHSSRQGDR